MVSKNEYSISLPEFLISSELSKKININNLHDLSIKAEILVFDWANVSFFDDYALLKLIFLQRELRLIGKRVRNAVRTIKQQSVLRQLWTVGLPELTASRHIIGSEGLKSVLRDEVHLLESDPLSGQESPNSVEAVIPMLCCHEDSHFLIGSREEKQLDAFIRSSLRLQNQLNFEWDLIENRDFRHLMLQQLRSNVREHSRFESGNTIGLAIVRVWTHKSLSDEWKLSHAMEKKLYTLWNKEPISSIFSNLGENIGALQISILDNGVGIPFKLRDVHDKMAEKGLFSITYKKKDLNEEFTDPVTWKNEKARLIAFSTNKYGSSKPTRANETKGLEYLRKEIAIKKKGALCIESDGVAVNQFTDNQLYGKSDRVLLNWCNSGGTGVSLAVPMLPVERSSTSKKFNYQSLNLITPSFVGESLNQINVRDYLKNDVSSIYKKKDLIECAQTVVSKLKLSENERDIEQLQNNRLLLINFGQLHESKDYLHFILIEIAKGLSKMETEETHPFIFVNLPTGLCGYLGKAFKTYSKLEKPITVLAYTAEHVEPFWLGLDDINHFKGEFGKKITCGIRRKITDKSENLTEAFYRDCLTRLLEKNKPTKTTDLVILSCANSYVLTDVKKSTAFSHLDGLIRGCALFREEQIKSPIESELIYTQNFQPVFNLAIIEKEVRNLFINKFNDTFTKPPVCFMPKNKGEGIELPHSKRISARYFRSDALVDNPIAFELTQQLTSIALRLANQVPGKNIDWIVSCTSPMHWFVHKLIDDLAEYDMNCSHHVFQSYEDISFSHEKIGMRPGETVLFITDVIASAQTAYKMAKSLKDYYSIKILGLITFADIRTKDDRENGPNIGEIYNNKIIYFYNEPEPNRIGELRKAYFVHPDTVVPKRVSEGDPIDDFLEINYSGTGPLIKNHAYFSSPKKTLDLMKSLSAVRYGHYQHGGHHSEIFIDVEEILNYAPFRNILVTALFRYIVTHDIRLVLYPSHSSAYILIDELKQRFPKDVQSVDFIMACRTFKGMLGTSYALTRFSPDPKPEWTQFSRTSVLILDDAVCTGETIKSIIAELVRVDRKYYENHDTLYSEYTTSEFSVHVIAFLNRLPRITSDFWSGLTNVANGQIHFSSILSMPLAAEPEELCNQCRLVKRLEHVKNLSEYCLS